MSPSTNTPDRSGVLAEAAEARPAAAVLLTLAAGVACAAAGWDAVGFMVAAPAWWPVPGYIGIAAGVALGCVAVLVDTFTRSRQRRGSRQTTLTMVTLGVLVGAWLLRGHPEIPADPPIIVAQLVAAVVLLLLSLRRR